MNIYRIRHYYDVGNQDIYVVRRSGDVDAKRAALYCQFKSEEWFAEDAGLMTLGVAALLTMFYGYRQAPVPDHDDFIDIDMYREREAAVQGSLYRELMADESLHRDGLRDHMKNFLN